MHKTMVPCLLIFALLFTCVRQIAAASNKALEEKIVALEKQGWEEIKKKDWNALGSLMTDDFVEVTEMGIRGKSEALEDLKANLILTEYAIEQVKLLELSKDAALLAYQLVIKCHSIVESHKCQSIVEHAREATSRAKQERAFAHSCQALRKSSASQGSRLMRLAQPLTCTALEQS